MFHRPQDLTDIICFQVKLPALKRFFILLFTWGYSFKSICDWHYHSA